MGYVLWYYVVIVTKPVDINALKGVTVDVCSSVRTASKQKALLY